MRREQANQTLQTTAIIHEAYLQLIDARQVQWQNRAHFFGLAARLMRQILVAFARARGLKKRGGGASRVSLDEALVVDEGRGEDLVALDEALGALTQFDARKAQVVELRFFGGLTEGKSARSCAPLTLYSAPSNTFRLRDKTRHRVFSGAVHELSLLTPFSVSPLTHCSSGDKLISLPLSWYFQIKS